jgi:glycosyltransferase involved in cell wall biosynthesis
MRLLVITSFPPSTRAANSFGYHAVLRFLEFPNVTELIVLADILDGELNESPDGVLTMDKKLIIDRCWHYNSIRCILDTVKSTVRYKPDIVWVNLQYTLFGVKPIPAFLGLCIPAILRLLQYPTVILLHNYLGGVDLDKMGLSQSGILRAIAKFADRIAMHSIIHSTKVFVMVGAYQKDLSNRYPNTDVEHIRQDLFAVPPCRPANRLSYQILTLGYFGTYKKLEILLDAFEIVRQTLPDAKLVIAGRDSMHAPGYIQRLREAYCNKLDNVTFTGYVAETAIQDLFWGSNLVVVTNSTGSGSSGVIELARVHGRAILVPRQIWDDDTPVSQSGVVLYDLANHSELVTKLVDLLSNPALQNQIGKEGYQYTFLRRNSFSQAHLRVFKDLTSNHYSFGDLGTHTSSQGEGTVSVGVYNGQGN